MSMLSNFLAAVLAGLGVFCGAAIANYAKEELKPGRRYFIILEQAVLAAFAAAHIYYSAPFYSIALSSALFISSFFREQIEKKSKAMFCYFAYAAFAVILFWSAGAHFFVQLASIIFLYGIPSGSIVFMEKKKFGKLAFAFAVFAVPFILIMALSSYLRMFF